MKKLILSAFVLLGASTVSNAQTPNPVKVKVNVILKSFQSIEIGSGAQNGETGYGDVVTLTYANAENYRNGVSALINNQLKVTSVGTGFKVKANLSNINLTRTSSAGVEKIPANEILEIEVGKNLAGVTEGRTVDVNGPEWDLSAVSSGQASVLDQELDVKYFGKPISDSQLKQYFNNVGNQAISYRVDVTYEVVPN
jgi:hypothetical protein